MKVIIELTKEVEIESSENEDELIITFTNNLDFEMSKWVKIEDLKLALRKLTAK